MSAAFTHIENEILFKKQIVFLDSYVDTNATVGTALAQLAEKEASGMYCHHFINSRLTYCIYLYWFVQRCLLLLWNFRQSAVMH